MTCRPPKGFFFFLSSELWTFPWKKKLKMNCFVRPVQTYWHLTRCYCHITFPRWLPDLTDSPKKKLKLLDRVWMGSIPGRHDVFDGGDPKGPMTGKKNSFRIFFWIFLHTEYTSNIVHNFVALYTPCYCPKHPVKVHDIVGVFSVFLDTIFDHLRMVFHGWYLRN